jgi:hypothetical protein
MAWRVYGEQIGTASLTSGVSQRVQFNSNIVLRACRIWLIFYNNPALTNLTMKIYSDDRGVARKLLHSSTTTLTKAQIITLANGIKEIYFEFDYPAFDADDIYHFVLTGTGYTGTDSTHIAWKHAWPDPVYTTGWTPSLMNLEVAPKAIYFIGSSLA